MRLAQAIPAVADGAPPWVYVVAVVASLIVAMITAAPTIIEKARANTTPPVEPKKELTSESGDRPEPPTDTLRSMIIDLQARLTRSENREDELQERVVQLTDALATARGEIAALRSQIQIMSMDRRSG